MERKLAAILAADVVGYSRLIAEDEARTLDALRALRREMFEPLVEEHRGEVVKRMGDGWLVSFASVVDAAQCAIQVQERLAGHDRIKLRIGVHLGDIVHEDEDIYGDGVNIAARLQEIAEPGGVLISGTAYESLVGRLDSKFEDAGEQSLKNVARPVRSWRWTTAAPVSQAPTQSAADTPPPLPDKPSIAVLPFANMSNDPEQEFLADGIAEDVTTALSKFGSLFVISRSSAFSYKGENASILRIAEELGVRYVVEGSIRRAGNRVRISAQLVDAATGNHLWAERFDGEVDDFFDLQDRITEQIVVIVAPEIEARERERLIKAPKTDLTVWALCQQAIWHRERYTEEHFAKAADLFGQIIKREPRFALAQAHYSYLLFVSIRTTTADDEHEILAKALVHANEAITLDPQEPMAYLARGRLQMYAGNGEQALNDVRTAIRLNPNFSAAYFGLGLVHYHSFGDAAEAIANYDIALRLGPRDPTRWIVTAHKGTALRQLGRHEEAIVLCREACQMRVGIFLNEMTYAAALGDGGELEEAAVVLARAIELQPKLSIDFVRRIHMHRHPTSLESLISALRKAGLRETAD